ncbi:MAG: ATP-binding cassette domain-containing protein, partial [Candidatus Ornithomonoglobus sp.]
MSEMNADTKILVKNLKKNFGKLKVLKDINCEIKQGEVVVLLGPSGSGKSTFLRCINRLEEITSGEAYVDGVNVADKKTNLNEIRQKVGMVFQHFNLFPHMTVLDNITL